MTRIRKNYLTHSVKKIKQDKKVVVFFNDDTFEVTNFSKLYDFLKTHKNVKHYEVA